MPNIELVSFKEFERYDPKDDAFDSVHCTLFPLVHSIIGNPAARHRFPRLPRGDDPLGTGNGPAPILYWDACYYYMTLILGWADPALGLWRYLEGGRQAEGSYELEVLKTIWDYDNQLDYLMAWLYRNPADGIRPWQSSFVHQNAVPLPRPQALALEAWWRDFEKRFKGLNEQERDSSPYNYGGTNPLHLGRWLHSLMRGDPGEAQENITGPYLFVSDRSKRRACLVLDSARQWYPILYQQGESLAPLGQRSWHVDIFAKTIGYLGIFRRSRVSGLWFSGRHHIHMQGNSHALKAD